jgi:hypothetical protein
VSLLKDARRMTEYLRRRTFFYYDDGDRYGPIEFKRTDREPEELNIHKAHMKLYRDELAKAVNK